MGQLSDSLNHSIQGIAAGFGTAQQQAISQPHQRASAADDLPSGDNGLRTILEQQKRDFRKW